MNFRLSSVVFASILLLGCAAHQGQDSKSRADSLEDFNHRMFDFNYNILDPYVLRPAATAWRNYVPMPARNGLNNFFSNLEEPASTVNFLLRGEPYKAMMHANRFLVNSLLGMGGFIDLASITNPKLIKEEPQRFGNTLGGYGIGYGPYLHLPFYGHFTVREDIGKLVDTLYPLLSCLIWWMFLGKWVLEGLESRAKLLDMSDLLNNSQDPYAMLRAAYFQRNDFLASGGISLAQDNPNAALIEENINSIDAQ